MITYMNELFNKGITKYDQIIKFIDEERLKHNSFVDEKNPGYRQVEYRLKTFRNTEVKPVIHLGDLMQWCENNSAFPVDENDELTAFSLHR